MHRILFTVDVCMFMTDIHITQYGQNFVHSRRLYVHDRHTHNPIWTEFCSQQDEQTAVYYGEFPNYPHLFHITLATQIPFGLKKWAIHLALLMSKMIVTYFGCPRYFSRHYLSRKCAGMKSCGRKEGGNRMIDTPGKASSKQIRARWEVVLC